MNRAFFFVLLFLLMGCTKKSEPEPTSATSTPAAAQEVAPISGTAVATLREMVSDVRIRRSKELIWNAASEGTGLSNYDAIKTGSASSSVVEFKDRTELRIKESSLVVIVDQKTRGNVSEAIVALNGGELQGTVRPEGGQQSELLIKTPRVWLRTKSQGSKPVKVQTVISKEGRLTVTTDTGPVQVISRGVEKVVEAGESLNIAAPAVLPEVETDWQNAELPPVASVQEWKIEKSEPPAPESTPTPTPTPTATPTPTPIPKATPASAPIVVPAPVVKKAEKPAKREKFFEITEPAQKLTTTQAQIQIRGRASKNYQIFIKNKQIVQKSDGSFATQVPLTSGYNLFTLQIVDAETDEVTYRSLEVTKK